MSLIDVAPTVLGALDLAIPEGGLGVSLRDLMAKCPERILAAGSTAYGPNGGAIWAGRWKLFVRGGRRMLFDLEADPGERTDLAASHPELLDTLSGELERRRAHAVTPAEPVPIVDPKLRRHLEALGYL